MNSYWIFYTNDHTQTHTHTHKLEGGKGIDDNEKCVKRDRTIIAVFIGLKQSEKKYTHPAR